MSIVCEFLKQLTHISISNRLFYQKLAVTAKEEPENSAPADQERTGGVRDQNDDGSESANETNANVCEENEEKSAEIKDGSNVDDKEILSQETYSVHGN